MVQPHPLVFAPMVHVTTSYNKIQSKLITKNKEENKNEKTKRNKNNRFRPLLGFFIFQSEPTARTPEMSAKELLADRTAQSALGLREVLWRLGTCLYPNTAREPFDAWFDRTSKEEHAAKYQEFAKQIMAA